MKAADGYDPELVLDETFESVIEVPETKGILRKYEL